MLENIAVVFFSENFAPAWIQRFFSSNGASLRIGCNSSASRSLIWADIFSFVSCSSKKSLVYLSTSSKLLSRFEKSYPGSIQLKKFNMDVDGKNFRRFTGTIKTIGFFSCIFDISSWIALRKTAVRKTVMDTPSSLLRFNTSFTETTLSWTWRWFPSFFFLRIWKARVFFSFGRFWSLE